MKCFVEHLFEWVKLDAGEQLFYFEVLDINEVSRNIVADWIPVLESRAFQYEIVIPEQEYLISVDVNAYNRIINNLLQNIITHSQGNKIKFQILENEQEMKIIWKIMEKGFQQSSFLIFLKNYINATMPAPARGTVWDLPLQRNW